MCKEFRHFDSVRLFHLLQNRNLIAIFPLLLQQVNKLSA